MRRAAKAGTVRYTDVLLALAQQSRALRDLIDARFFYTQAWVELELASGAEPGRWQRSYRKCFTQVNGRICEPMVNTLLLISRMTLSYDFLEDRISMISEFDVDTTMSLDLTRRFLNKLVRTYSILNASLYKGHMAEMRQWSHLMRILRSKRKDAAQWR